MKGPFQKNIRIHLSHLYAYNDTHDGTRSSAVTFSFEADIESRRIVCFDILFHLENSGYLKDKREMKVNSFLHVKRIEFFRDESIQHLDFVEDIFIDNFWIGRPSCAETCPKDKLLNECPGKPCMGITGTTFKFQTTFL